VYEVEPDTAGAPTFTADYDLITDVGDEPFVDDWVRPRDSVLDFEPARNCRGAETPLPTPGVAMPKIAKPKAGPENIASKLSARGRLILFCAAAGIEHAAVGITARAMQAIAIRGLITRDRELGGTYVLTETGRAAVAATLERAGIKIAARRPTAPG